MRLESGTRTGWLFNYHSTSEALDTDEGSDDCGGAGATSTNAGNATQFAALELLFQDHEGEVFSVSYRYNPYFLVSTVEGHERDVELGLLSTFPPPLIQQVVPIEKEDLDMINHLSGKKRVYLKVIFANVQDLSTVRARLETAVKRNASVNSENPLLGHLMATMSSSSGVGLEAFSGGSATFGAQLGSALLEEIGDAAGPTASGNSWMDWLADIREYDVKYTVRVAIDEKIYVGLWYDVTVREGVARVEQCDDSKYPPAMPKVCAFDIETTKAPLKFPQPEVDQIYMISYMLDGRGYLIVNREIVTEDIDPFEYTPKPEYEGIFDTFNEQDEYGLLRRFFDEMIRHRPNVFVTYNGDYFDYPFIHARALFHGMNMQREIGFNQNAEGAFLNRLVPHLDCFYWVKRDSYLPQGSQGLKAVTKYKLGYDPIEVDPEEMLPLAQSNPQRMASYSVSDAVSTWYLYQKYVHPFIFSLCTIIPMPPDDVLRKGSGGLCEALLMVQAYAKNVVFPNKQEQQREKFYNGHLIDAETYIGGRVEALKCGTYRSNIPMHFSMNPDTYQQLIDDLDSALHFAIEVENGMPVGDVVNYEEVKAEITAKLMGLRDHPDQFAVPLIYHLDVGAMYPNIILTNRLQPYAIKTDEVCAGCCFNTPDNASQCKRSMEWVWRGEMFTAGRYEFQRVKAQLENESFAAAAVQKADLAAVQKKTYGNRKGNVLEGTAYERKQGDFGKSKWGQQQGRRGGGGGGGGYRQMNRREQQEAASHVLAPSRRVGGDPGKSSGAARRAGDGSGSDGSDCEGGDDEGADGKGAKSYHKLQENTKFNLLKKRLGEYSRKAYGKVHESREILKSAVVCQREDSFYVDTVRLFRDRRYEYKAGLKRWKDKLDAATDPDDIKLFRNRCVQMESLQLAHKCILNSFYGYVMRKGSRWGSMEMAGVVTYLGATLIQMARALVQQIGVTLELDTDGIWCCLPKTFPENFTFKTSNAKKATIKISYPCVVLNKMVNDRYTNHQYQDLDGSGAYRMRSECSIYFEIDGPYLAMLLPASREEGKSIKKRYAVFHPDGRLAELKGFELKRRGELMLVKDFQAQVFRRFLDGTTLQEAYASAAEVADAALDMLYTRGDGYETNEVLDKLTESSNMTRRLTEYGEGQKSLALTTARRIAELLGPQMVKDKGLACHFVISRLPHGRPVTERAIPITVFRLDPSTRAHFLRKWTGDNAVSEDLDLKDLLDWDYYIERFNACVQKIITIPAALQSVPNPVPRVKHPQWLQKRVQQMSSKYRQVRLDGLLSSKQREAAAAMRDIEDIIPARAPEPGDRASLAVDVDHNSDSDVDSGVENEEAAELQQADAERARQAKTALNELRLRFLTPKSTRELDGEFFGDECFGEWLTRQREGWAHRAQLRRQVLDFSAQGRVDGLQTTTDSIHQVMEPREGTGRHPRGVLSSSFIDTKSRALAARWNVLEVREDAANPDAVVVFVLLERTLLTLSVKVRRTVYVDLDPKCVSELLPLLRGAVRVTNRVLPRSLAHEHVYEVPVPPGPAGDELLNDLQCCHAGVRKVYEGHISAVARFVECVGCCAVVNTALHLQRAQSRSLSDRDAFHLDELDSANTVQYFTGNVSSQFAFVFHISSESRGVLGVLYRHSNTALVVFIQPLGAARPNLNWSALSDEASASLGLQSGDGAPQVTVEVVADATSAWKRIGRSLVDAVAAPNPPFFSVLHSTLSTSYVVEHRLLPQALAIMRVAGASEDERLLADPFRWSRSLSRRMLQRYFASILWVDERLAISRLANIPLCNLAPDSCVHALDVMYTRALHRRMHVMWDARAPDIAFDTLEERPRQVVFPGGDHTWAVEFSISHIDVVATLFSQAIQEGDDPRMHILCGQGVRTHFNVLRDVLSDLMGIAVAKKEAAVSLLVNVARWIRDPVSTCYEPRLIEHVSNLVHRTLTALLLRVAKLGGRTIRADSNSIVVATPKHTLCDAISFASFLVASQKDQPLLNHLSLRPTRYWCPLLVLDTRNWAGMFLPADEALRTYSTMSTDPPPDCMSFSSAFSLWGVLPPALRPVFSQRIQSALRTIRHAKQLAHDALQSEPRVNLATRSEKCSQLTVQNISKLVEEELHSALIEEVHAILESREAFPSSPVSIKTGVASVSPQDAALEYTKVTSHVLELLPGAAIVIGKARNNCLRLCGVGPFAPSARFTPRLIDYVQRLPIRCSYCNDDVLVDLSAPWGDAGVRCATCHAPFSITAIESHLVRRVSTLLLSFSQQDYACSRCRQVTSTILASSCCGELRGTHRYPIHSELAAHRVTAAIQNFQWLAECIENAMAMI